MPRVLENYFGVEAEQIDYIPVEQKTTIKLKNNQKHILRWFYQVIYHLGIVFFNILTRKKLYQRKQAFDDFMNEVPHSEIAYEFDSINKCVDQYQLFICGGDQIWNDYKENKNIKVYTLQFVPSCEKNSICSKYGSIRYIIRL